MELAGLKRELVPFEVDGFAHAQAVAVHHENEQVVAKTVALGLPSRLSLGLLLRPA